METEEAFKETSKIPSFVECYAKKDKKVLLLVILAVVFMTCFTFSLVLTSLALGVAIENVVDERGDDEAFRDSQYELGT